MIFLAVNVLAWVLRHCAGGTNSNWPMDSAATGDAWTTGLTKHPIPKHYAKKAT